MSGEDASNTLHTHLAGKGGGDVVSAIREGAADLAVGQLLHLNNLHDSVGVTAAAAASKNVLLTNQPTCAATLATSCMAPMAVCSAFRPALGQQHTADTASLPQHLEGGWVSKFRLGSRHSSRAQHDGSHGRLCLASCCPAVAASDQCAHCCRGQEQEAGCCECVAVTFRTTWGIRRGGYWCREASSLKGV